ncbi:hypothetical protein Patl1_29749 [Pistacia atlantica]|uniref:Uncharacterized protein n=1 Tax=Pistacia atlantica TaxID=434234 RepID=A0ACC1AAD3_9ROSI|nr:hypothetical protein Patl1_29749 [Pistacia atlantica]
MEEEERETEEVGTCKHIEVEVMEMEVVKEKVEMVICRHMEEVVVGTCKHKEEELTEMVEVVTCKRMEQEVKTKVVAGSYKHMEEEVMEMAEAAPLREAGLTLRFEKNFINI